MASNNIGRWSGSSTMDATGYTQGIQAMENSTKRARASVDKDLSGMKASIDSQMGGMAGAFGAMKTLIPVAAITAGIAAINSTVGDAENFGALNDQLGTSIEFLSTMRTVAGEAGVEANTFTGAMERLNQNIGNASQGGAEAQRVFRRLGLEWQEIASGDADTNIRRIAEAFGQVENRSERARLSAELFGRGGGSAMLRIMNGQLGTAMSDAGARGGTVTSEMQKNMLAIDAAIDRLSTRWSNTWRSFVASTAPAITGFFNEVDRIATGVVNAWRTLTTPRISLEPPPGTATPAPGAANLPTAADFPLSGFGGFAGAPPPAGNAPPPIQTVAQIEASLPELRAAAEEARAARERRRVEAILARGAEENARADASGLGLSASSTARRAELAAASEVAANADAMLARAESRASDSANALGQAEQRLTSARDAEQARLRAVGEQAGTLEGNMVRAAQTFGLTGDRLEIMRLRLEGATDAQLQAAERMATNAEREAARRAELLRGVDEGTRLTTESRSPADIFAEEMARLDTSFQDGNISAQTFGRSLARAQAQLAQGVNIPAYQMPGQFEAGSAASVSLMNANRAARSTESNSLAELVRIARERQQVDDRRAAELLQAVNALQSSGAI